MSNLKKGFKPTWLIAPAIVAVWILIMFFIKDVYPFGEGTMIAYDLRHGGVPALYYVYDAWHSGDFSRLFYDFTTAGGFSREILFTLFQPRYLFTLLWERENLTYAVDVFFIVEFALIALSASYSFSKLFPKLASSWVVMISVMYALNGFSLLYLTNTDWLDTVLIYPLIILFAYNMINGRSKVPFFIALTYTLTINTYMAFFVVLSLVVFGGLYIFIIEEKDNRKNAILNLGVGTGASLLAAAYPIVNYAISMFGTARFDEGSYVLDSITGNQKKLSGISGILNAPNEVDIVSIFMFLGTSVALASLVVLWVHFKKHKDSRKYTVFFTITIVLFVLQIIFKSVMLIWHLGSYQKFPFRNGFMVSFFCCCIVAYYFSRFGSLEGVKTKFSVVNFFTFVPAFFAAIAIASYADVLIFTFKNNFYVLSNYINYQTGCMAYPFASFALATIVCFLLIKLINLKALRNALTFILAMVVVGINSFCLIAECSYSKDNQIYKKEFEVRENIKQKDVLSRVVNNDGTLMINYPYVSGVSAISNWTHNLPGEHLDSFSNLGFCSFFTYVYDVGGTVFSRALLRVTDTLTESKLDDSLYTEYKTTAKGMNYYHNKYNLPVGLAFSEAVKSVNVADCKNLFEYQNNIYNALDGDGDLFEKVEYKSVTERTKKEKYYVNKEKKDGSGMGVFMEMKPITTTTYIFDVHDKSVLYLHKLNKDEAVSFIEISINGEDYHVYDGTSIINSESSVNTQYPNSLNNGILELGVFENETVRVKIKYTPGSKTTNDAGLYLMDLNKMAQLCDEVGDNEYVVNSGVVKVTTKGNQGDIAFIPISYDEHWKCTVNGENIEPVCVLGDFIGVELDEGENEIAMKFSCSEGCIKLLLTVIGLLLGVLVLVAEKRIKIPKGVYTFTFVAFAVVFVGAILVIYVVPSGWSAVTGLLGLLKG